MTAKHMPPVRRWWFVQLSIGIALKVVPGLFITNMTFIARTNMNQRDIGAKIV